MKEKGPEKGDHLSIVIGASKDAEAIRRLLVRRGLPHAGTAGHLRGLRRSLVAGGPDRVTVYVALDDATLDRYGRDLRSLLLDLKSFPGFPRIVGLLTDGGLVGSVAELGCDVYVTAGSPPGDLVRMMSGDGRSPRLASRMPSRPRRLPGGRGSASNRMPRFLMTPIDRFV